MQIFYLANVGTRDVVHNGAIARSARTEGEQWLRDFDALEPQLDAPILLPGLGHVLKESDSSSEPVRVVLFYSDQDAAKTEERYGQSDTLHFAGILEKLLPRRLGGRVRVQIVRIEGSPADYNNTLPFFHAALPGQVKAGADDVIYVAPVGGADASNVGLAINAVRHYRDRCQLIYVLEKVGVQLIKLHAELLADYARREAEAHLDRRDYVALEQTLRRARLGEVWHQQLCAYADCRTRFDFQGASTAIAEAQKEPLSGQARARLGRLGDELKPFLGGTPPPQSTSSAEEWEAWYKLQGKLLAELFFNLKRKVLQGEWVDFLSRLFRLQEAVLRLVFEKEKKHSTHKHPGAGFRDFLEAIEADAGLLQWFQDKEVRFEEPNTRNLEQALRYWIEKGGKGATWGKLYSAMKVIGNAQLTDLRNQSIAAHGYQGVSREDVERKAKKSVEELLEQMRQAIAELGQAVGSDPYDALDGHLREALGGGS